MSPQLFFSQNIYYIYIEDLLKNLSLQMYPTASVSLSHIHNRESATVHHIIHLLQCYNVRENFQRGYPLKKYHKTIFKMSENIFGS